MKHVRETCVFDFKLIASVKYEDYVISSYPNFKNNAKFQVFSHGLDLRRNNGLPKCIIKIVQIINEISYFNTRIRQFIWAFTWSQQIFWYYDRYYRYLRNEKLFGKKTFLNYRHGHKLHFISCIKNRELTGARINKNHMVL